MKMLQALGLLPMLSRRIDVLGKAFVNSPARTVDYPTPGA